jgi:NADPH-dependent curcumin reductase
VNDINRVWRLRQRPVGEINSDTLTLAQEPMPQPRQGEFLFRLDCLSLDPTNRIWMSDIEQYMPPVALGAPMRGVV